MIDLEQTAQPEETGSAPQHFGLPQEVVERVTAALNDGKKTAVQQEIQLLHSADVAELISQLKPDSRKALVRILRRDLDPEVLVDLDPEMLDEVAPIVGVKRLAGALERLDLDEAVYVIEDLEVEEQQKIINAITDEQQKQDIQAALDTYPEDSAGRIMRHNMVTVPSHWNVGQVIDFMRAEEQLPDDFYSFFVVDSEKKPAGHVLVSRVLRKQREVQLTDIMEREIKSIHTMTDQEEVAYMFRKYGLASAPVVDEEGRVVGVITLDDIVDVVSEEEGEDMLKMGGVESTDIYARTVETAFNRFPWLFINLITAILASTVVALFDQTIERFVTLAVLMPIVASMGGNAAIQTLTVAVRGLATKELTRANTWQVVRKEFLASCVNGFLLAVVIALVCLFVYRDVALSLILASSVLGVLVIASLSGALVPLILHRLGIDPAVSSSVFVTTCTDMAAFLFLLGLATLVLI